MKKIISSAVSTMLLFCVFTCNLFIVSAAAPTAVYNIPKTLKIGDILTYDECTEGSLTITGSNLPVKPDHFFYVTTPTSLIESTIGLRAYGPGDINPDGTSTTHIPAGRLYKPGTFTIQACIINNNDDARINVGQSHTFTVQEPVITTNEPKSITAGQSINFKTQLTNVNIKDQKNAPFEDQKNYDSDGLHYDSINFPIAYKPSVTVVSGQDIIKQSKQDYSNILNTNETLTFLKAGTVKLKITYKQIKTDPDLTSFYSPEKLVTINVTENPAGSSSSKDNPSSASVSSEKKASQNSGKNSASLSADSSPAKSSAAVPNTSQDSAAYIRPAEEAPVTISNEDTGIILGAEDGVIPDGAVLLTNEISAGEKYNKAKKSVKNIAAKFSVFEISLENDNVKIQPNGKVAVSVPIPSGFNKSKLAVYFIDDDGGKTELSSFVDGDKITFETDHFSTYVIAEKTAPLAPSVKDRQPNKKSPVIWIVLIIFLVLLISGLGAWLVRRMRYSNSSK